MIFIASCKLGLESTVVFELKKLGMENISSQDGNVSFEGDYSSMAKALLYLRTAERLLLKIGSFQARSFEELFQGVKALDFTPYMQRDSRIHVNGKSAKSTLFSVSDCQSIAKKAIVENLKQALHTPLLPETGAEVIVEIGLLKDQVTVALDCCGAGLSRRGYRTYNVAAPLSETLGAALVILSRYWPDTPLIDPMCGSGTIPIEAAMIGNNIAPSLNRRFAAESWPFLGDRVFLKAREEARDCARHDKLPILGSDIDPRSVALSRIHAQKAGVDIEFREARVQELKAPFEKGTILCNPPYGERMLTQRETVALMEDIRKVFDRHQSYQIGIISGMEDFEKVYGKKADKRRKLSNGGLKCTFYQYFPPREGRKE